MTQSCRSEEPFTILNCYLPRGTQKSEPPNNPPPQKKKHSSKAIVNLGLI